VCGVGQVSLSVCVLYEECRVAVNLLERLSVWCSAGPSVCVCVIRGMPSSCWSAGESERVVFGRSICVCVSYEECRVAVNVLERVSVWCWAGPSVCACVIRGMPSSCRSAGEIECVVLCRSIYVCVLYEERRVAVDLLQRVSVVLGRSVCVCVCVSVCASYEECRVAIRLL